MRYLRFALCFLLLGMPVLFMAGAASAQVVISVGFAPPELPVYEQPICPGDGYIWTPGYWAWDGDDYYWVPGTWVLAPEVGYFWTPPYWGWGGSAFIFHAGYWGPVVGFYGGINYGFGYFGHGFSGGRWEGGHFFYNTAVWHVNRTEIRNVYEERVNVRENVRVSYNGGRGGIEARPTREEEAAEHERHIGPDQNQIRHQEAARSNREFKNSVNHGKPPVTATPRPGEFSGHEAAPGRETTRAEGGPGNNNRVHPKDLPAYERPAAPNTGNTKLDQKYQKQQEDMARKQDLERQKLQQRQDKEHQQYTRQNANEARNQQLEQKHTQQTQQMQQRHVQQQQQMQQRQLPSHQTSGHQESAPKEKH
ncbi:MAG TPA: hypothetical protein VKB40_06320 [Candidatus Acidoferrales bacterium]|nr:hypothetical protein [Candidatus Acidoferrales bacterium]